jgi:hypothetical protein
VLIVAESRAAGRLEREELERAERIAGRAAAEALASG